MNLNKLLAVGKSFFGIRSERSPYELRQENLLPRFGPVRETVATAPAKATANKSSYTRSAIASAQSLFRTTFVPKSVENHSGRVSVQGQFTLESVKVMRNDLRDADLELTPVSVKSGAISESAMGVPALNSKGEKTTTARFNSPLTQVGGVR